MSFTSDISIVTQALNQFYSDTLAKAKPVLNQQELDHIVADLKLEHYAQNGGLANRDLKQFLDKYLSYVTRLHHANNLGHQCAPPHYSSALGSLVTGFANTVSSIYEMGPASVSLEYFVINWMLEKVGWEKVRIRGNSRHAMSTSGGGVLVNGGSIANLTALTIARSKVVPEVWKTGSPSNLALLLPAESHYALTKAAGIMGIGAQSIYYIDGDETGAIRPDSIPGTFKKVMDDGKIPIALAANACSTSVGIYDPLDEIGDFCRENKLWFHVDGAHGASALLSDKHMGLLKGVQKADSLVWDAHKLLQTPSLCAALLVKNLEYLDQGFQIHQNASYLFHEKHQPGFDSIHRTIETTKSGLGEKLFFVLAGLGEKGLARYIDNQYQLAQEAYTYIREHPNFECPISPQSNILCFRIKGDDALQMHIRNHLTKEGTFYLTTVAFKEKRYLRLVFMSENTTLETVKELVSEIMELSKGIRD